jgi:hypothetical protein
MNPSRKKFSFLIAATVYLLLIGITQLRIHSEGAQVQRFALDDAYISGGIASHIAFDHTWGISPAVFSAASSSILWPIALAGAFKLFGAHMLCAFLLNILFGVFLLYVGFRFVAAELRDAPTWLLTLILLAMLFAMSLPMLTFIAMEHIAFAIASLLFCIYGARALSRADGGEGFSAREGLILFALAALSCGFRYEGMFPCFIVGLLLLARRRILSALAIAAGAALPIASFGLFSIQHGGRFFPNSLLRKAGPTKASFHPVLFRNEQGLLSTYSIHSGFLLLWLLLVGIFCYDFLQRRCGRSMLSSTMRYMTIIVSVAVVFHCQFSRLNWLWRYESYLVCIAVLTAAIGLVSISAAGNSTRLRSTVCIVVAFVVSLGLLGRSWNSVAIIPHDAYSIYEQQYQTGLFLARFYPGQSVALNDIGVPSFLSRTRILDFVGLGSLEVTERIASNRFNSEAMQQLAAEHHARIAILYRAWFKGPTAPPASWAEVGSWTIRPRDSRVPIADTTFTFFAITPGEVSYLHDSLCAFGRQLPSDETVAVSAPCVASH